MCYSEDMNLLESLKELLAKASSEDTGFLTPDVEDPEKPTVEVVEVEEVALETPAGDVVIGDAPVEDVEDVEVVEDVVEVIAPTIESLTAIIAEKDTQISELEAANGALRDQLASYTTAATFAPTDDFARAGAEALENQASVESFFNSIN